MNNFSELQATEIALPVVIVLEPVFDTLTPEIVVTVAQKLLYEGCLSNSITLESRVDLLSSFDIKIQLKNKNYSRDHTSAVVISQLNIDSHDLVPQWSHLAHYRNDKNYQLPTTHLGFNGEWQMSIDEPFYRWWHRTTGQGWLLIPSVNKT